MSILNGTLKIKAYGNYIKRTLTILRYKYLKTPTGLHLRDLNNYFNAMGYGSLTRKASQYHKYCTTSLMRTTVRNGQMKKFSYSSKAKDPSIRTPSTTVLNHVHQLP